MMLTPASSSAVRPRSSAEQGCGAVLLIGAVAAALFAMRLAAPPNLLDQDQENPAAYVLDVVKNGNWLCQRDLLGEISSKPPLYTWLAALATLASGRVTLFSMYLPGAVALLGMAGLVFAWGRTHFGARAGLFGALACLLCTAGVKQIGLARTDGVFALTVTVGAWLAYRAWVNGKGWTWFWLAASAATLTKGPLGLLLSGIGLLVVPWERRSGNPLPLRGAQFPGVLLFIVITVGWLGLACWQLGRPVIDKLLLRELLWHVVEGENKTLPGSTFYLSPLYYLARVAPWSVFGYLGLWRTWRFPSVDMQERRFERFIFCWFVGGLVLFSLAPHQRGDLLWPILPAGALLAGRELARLTARANPRKLNSVIAVVVLLGVAGFTFYYFGPRARHPLVQQTIAIRELAREVEKVCGLEAPLTHLGDPTGFQVYLNTSRAPVSAGQAAALLRGPEAAFVAVSDFPNLQAARHPKDPPIYTVLEDRGPVARLHVTIVGNRPKLELTNRMALAVGPWLVRYRGHLLRASGDQFVFALGERPGEVTVVNQGAETRPVRLRFAGKNRSSEITNLVAPGQRVNASIEP